MSTPVLLGIALAAVAVLLVLVIRLKVPAYVALLLVSMLTAIATGIPIGDVVPTMIEGMGNVLGSVAIVVGLGAMIGRLIELSGGAERLAATFTERLGTTRLVGALVAASFVFGIPVFFDVGFIILAPILFGFAAVAGINPVRIALPAGLTLLALHVAVPPHPGPVAAAATLGTDVGLLTLVGLILCVPVAVAGLLISRRMGLEKIELGDSPARAATRDSADPAGGTGGVATRTDPGTQLGTGTVIGIIALPIVLILVGSTVQTVVGEDSAAYPYAAFAGAPTTALLVGLLVAYVVVGNRVGWGLTQRGDQAESALPMVATIIFVTGAGGVFGNVLVVSGIGDALASSLQAAQLPVIVAAFVTSLALRAAQGSATVAILTTAGLLLPSVEGSGYSSFEVVLVTLSIAFGALGASHINDSGFWIVTRYLGLSVADGLRTWTVLTTVCAVLGFGLTAAVHAVA